MGWKNLVGAIGKGMIEMLPFGRLVTAGLEGIGGLADAVGGETGTKIKTGIGAITEGLKEIGQTALPPETQARILENKNNKEIEMAKIAYDEKKLTFQDQSEGRDVIKTALLSDDPLVRQARPKMMLLLGKTAIGYTIGTPVLVAILAVTKVDAELIGLITDLILWQGATLWSAFTASFTGYTVARTSDKKTAKGIMPGRLLKLAAKIGTKIS